MSILKVYKYPDPVLKQISIPVTDFNNELKNFIADHVETMYSFDFCVGLAAPQVGNLQRIITVDVSKARKPQDGHGLLVLINPKILEYADFKIVREGCLSIPDLTANVKRAMKIKVEYLDEQGNQKTLDTTNFEAHAIQHEMDHLDGILFLDKITNPASDLFRRKTK